MANQRRGGVIQVNVGGVTVDCYGQWSYSLLKFKRESIVGPDGNHGYKELPVAPYIEGEITDSASLDVAALLATANKTVTLRAANGKTVMLAGGTQTGEGTTQTENGNIQVKFEGTDAQELT